MTAEISKLNDRRLFARLSDGRFHSSLELAEHLQVSRHSLRKRLLEFRVLGVPIQAKPGSGFSLASPLDPLDGSVIAEELCRNGTCVGDLQVLTQVDSTNLQVRRRAGSGVAKPVVALAECQSAGRGRRGRAWTSAYGAGIWLSVLSDLRIDRDKLSKLSLVMGLAAVKVLERYGVSGLGLKWPNDILVKGCKLGGVLVECEAASHGADQLIVGIGINTVLPLNGGPGANYPATDLIAALGPERLPPRSRLAADLVKALLDALAQYDSLGWPAFASNWERFDLVANQQVAVTLPDGAVLMGEALGIDDEGAMWVGTADGPLRCLAGEVSLRPRR